MRVIANIDRVRIEAPDYAAHKGDNNVFTVYRKTPAANHTFILALANGPHIETYTANTSNKVIQWDVTEFIRTIPGGTTIQAAVYEGSTSAPVQFWECTFVVYEGITMVGRQRGSESVIVTLPDNKVELYLRGACTIYNGPDAEREEYAGSEEYIMSIEHRGLPSLLINYTATYAWGTLWNISESDRRTYRLVQPCMSKDMVIVEYVNADGCIRYAAGRVIRDTYSTSQIDYEKNVGAVRGKSHRHVTGVGESIEIGFDNIEPGQYLEDIMLCDEVKMHGTDIVAVPVGSSVTRDGKTKDMIITFKIR